MSEPALDDLLVELDRRLQLYPNQFQVVEIRDYITRGVPLSSFTEAVVCNDLKMACMCADTNNRRWLVEIVGWFHQFAPSSCWGNQQLYIEWVAHRGWAGLEEQDI